MTFGLLASAANEAFTTSFQVDLTFGGGERNFNWAYFVRFIHGNQHRNSSNVAATNWPSICNACELLLQLRASIDGIESFVSRQL